MTLWGGKVVVTFLSYTNGWLLFPKHRYCKYDKCLQLCLLLPFPQPLWTTPFAASVSCPCLQECPTCHVSELLLSWHTMVFMLSFCCSPCSFAHKLDSITWRTWSTSPPLWLLARRHQLVTRVVSQFSSLCHSFHGPPTKWVSSFSVYSPPNTTTQS